MFLLQYKWEQLPGPHKIAKQLETKYKLDPLASFLIVALLALISVYGLGLLPRLLDQSYLLLLVTYITTVFVRFFICAWIVKDGKLSSIFNWIFAAAVVIHLILIAPFNFEMFTRPTNILEENVTYVTKRTHCKYCKAARTQMLASVNLYNTTHPDQIKIVDLEEPGKVSKMLAEKAKTSGVVYKNTGTQEIQSNYLLIDKNNNPVSPSVPYVYNVVKDVIDN